MKQISSDFFFPLLMGGVLLLSLTNCKKDNSSSSGSNNGKTTAVFNSSVIYGSMTDQDGNTYKTVVIGTQTWMAENLRTTKYRNGDPILLVTAYGIWPGYNNAAYCNFNNTQDLDTIATYGRLYNWYAVKDARNIAPTGWHVPSIAEWTALESYIGGQGAGGKLKETNFTHWLSPNRDATNETGFTALPDGWRGNYGGFYDIGSRGSWWSSSEYDTDGAWFLGLGSEFGNGYSSNGFKWFGLSVRCLKD